jgi:hypothetical protein
VRRVEKKERIQYKKTEKSGSVFQGGRLKGNRKREEKGEREPGGSNGVPKKLAGGLLHRPCRSKMP